MNQLTLLLKCLLLSLISLAFGEPVCESCSFNTTPADEPDCSVYSTFGGEFQAWYRASEPCLDALGVDMAAVDKTKMWDLCPTDNDIGSSGDSIRMWLRDHETNATQTIKSMFPAFFELDASTGMYVLRPNITGTQAQFVDCTATRTGSLCWGEIAIFFSNFGGERAKVCQTLHQLQIRSLIREQARARVDICSNSDNENITAVCEPLSTQISESSVADCTMFGGVSENQAVNCTEGGGGDGSSAGRSSTALGAVAGVMLAYLAFV